MRTIAVDVLAEAYSPSDASLHLREVSQPAHGLVTLDDGGLPEEPSDALLIYTPEVGFTGVETVTYWVCDDRDGCSVATITFRVPPPSPTARVCLVQMRPLPSPTEASDPEVEIETRLHPLIPPATAGLTTPLPGDRVAGTAVAIALVDGPGAERVQSASVPVVVANTASVDTLDITEQPGAKTEVEPGHVVVTAEGTMIEVPVGTLATSDTLTVTVNVLALNPGQAPHPLPEIAAGAVREMTLARGQTAVAKPLTLWLPYADRNQDGRVDGTEPPMAETHLTLWRYDSPQAAWVHLPEAVILPALNPVRVQTSALGHFVLVRADDDRTGTVGTTSTYAVTTPTTEPARSGPTSSRAWQTLGSTAAPPHVVAWDTTQVPDGDYELRAVCAADPSELLAFESPVSTPSGGGSC